MMNEHKADKQSGAAPAQGVTRRDFLQRATRAVIGGGILVGALAAPMRAMACTGSSNTCSEDACPTGDTCVSNACTKANYCAQTSGDNTCTASDGCVGNYCYHSDGCQSYNECEGGSNVCVNNHTCGTDFCSEGNTCSLIDDCNVNTCTADSSTNPHCSLSNTL